jgi:hypothetical protein
MEDPPHTVSRIRPPTDILGKTSDIAAIQPLSTMKFPLEQTTRKDFNLWKDTIQLLTSPNLWMSPKMGKYLRPP